MTAGSLVAGDAVVVERADGVEIDGKVACVVRAGENPWRAMQRCGVVTAGADVRVMPRERLTGMREVDSYVVETVQRGRRRLRWPKDGAVRKANAGTHVPERSGGNVQ